MVPGGVVQELLCFFAGKGDNIRSVVAVSKVCPYVRDVASALCPPLPSSYHVLHIPIPGYFQSADREFGASTSGRITSRVELTPKTEFYRPPHFQ